MATAPQNQPLFINPLDPSSGAQAIAIQRRQQMADMLRKQSLEPSGPTEMVSGWAVKKSPMEGLAKIAQALGAGYMQNQNDKDVEAFSKDQAEKLAAMFKMPDAAPSVPASEPVQSPEPLAPPADAASAPPDQAMLASALKEYGGSVNDIMKNPTQSPTTQALAQILQSGARSSNMLPGSPGGSQAPAPEMPASQPTPAAQAPLSAPGAYPASPQRPAAGNPFNPLGVDPRLAAIAFRLSPEKYMESALGAYKPADIVGQIRAMGIDPNSDQGRAIASGHVEKQNYIAPTSLRPGGFVQNKDGSRDHLPHVPEGYQAVKDQTGQWSIVKVNGGLEAIADTATAKARGPANFNTQKVWNSATGTYEYQTAATVADAAGGKQSPSNFPSVSPQEQRQRDSQALELARQDVQNARTPADRGKAQQVLDTMVSRFNAGQSVMTGPAKAPSSAFAAEAPFGASAAADVMGKSNATVYQDLKKQAEGASDRLNSLDNILEIANGGTKFGPGTSARLEKLSTLNSFLPPGQMFGNNDTANAQVMQKYVSNLAGQYMKSLGGTGTDAQLANSLKSIANPDMMNDAIREVVPKLKALEAAQQAKVNGYDNWLQRPGNTVDRGHLYESQFRRAYDPRIFQLSQMSPEEQAAFVEKMPKNDARELKLKRQTLREMGAL